MNKFMVTGIDIHHHRITAVTLMRQKQSFCFVSLKVFPTSAGIFSENEVLNYQKIVKKLTEIRKGLPFFQRRVSIAIPDLAVISRTVHPEHQENQVMEAWGVYQAFAEMTSLPKEGLRFDYTPLVDGFQVYAAKREVVDSRLTALRLAKLQPILVDTEKQAFLQCLLEAMRIYQRRDWMMIEVGDVAIHLGFISRTQMFFRRIPYEQDENQMLSGRDIVTVRNRVVEEIRRFRSLDESCRLDGIWLMGASPHTPWLVQLQRGAECPIEPFCPSQFFVRKISVRDACVGRTSAKNDVVEPPSVEKEGEEKERIKTAQVETKPVETKPVETKQIVGERWSIDVQQGTALAIGSAMRGILALENGYAA